jgi:hypothetical protein
VIVIDECPMYALSAFAVDPGGDHHAPHAWRRSCGLTGSSAFVRVLIHFRSILRQPHAALVRL